MKLLILTAAHISLLALTCTDAAAQLGRRRPAKVDLEHLTYTSGTFQSKALEAKTNYSVFLPRGYDPAAKSAKRYPLILFLHGMWEDHRRFHGRGGAAVLDKMVGDGTLPECVFVCAHDASKGSFYINGKRLKVEDMILKDLLPHVERTYPVKKGRAHRALLGVSMGGFGALKIAFKNPKAFGVVASHSAAILPEKSDELLEYFPWAERYADRLIKPVFGKPIDEKLWAAENPMTIARSLDKVALAGLKIYFDCGDADRYRFHTPNLALHKLLKKRGIPHAWRLVEGGNHGWNTRRTETGYNQTALPHSLRFIAGCWAQKKGASGPGGLIDGSKKGG